MLGCYKSEDVWQLLHCAVSNSKKNYMLSTIFDAAHSLCFCSISKCTVTSYHPNLPALTLPPDLSFCCFGPVMTRQSSKSCSLAFSTITMSHLVVPCTKRRLL